MSLLTEIQAWFDERQQALIDSYNETGRKASGNWEKELESEVRETGGKIKGRITGARYTEQLIRGRRPNKNQSPESLQAFVGWAGSTFLKDWVKNKGLSINPYAVARKIATQGIEVPNAHNQGDLISRAFPQEELNGLRDIVRKHFGRVIIEEVTK